LTHQAGYRWNFKEASLQELKELYDLIPDLKEDQLDYLASFVNGDVKLLRLGFQSGVTWLIDYLRRGGY
jgi:hypothetical protein